MELDSMGAPLREATLGSKINKTDAEITQFLHEMIECVNHQGEYDQEHTATFEWDSAMDLVVIATHLWAEREILALKIGHLKEQTAETLRLMEDLLL